MEKLSMACIFNSPKVRELYFILKGTPEALKAVTELLDGETLATVSTYADEIRSNPAMDGFKIWHYVNLPLDKKYQEVEHTQDNVVTAIEKRNTTLAPTKAVELTNSKGCSTK